MGNSASQKIFVSGPRFENERKVMVNDDSLIPPRYFLISL